MNYADEKTGECTSFVTVDDRSLIAARNASVIAFVLGLGFLSLAATHNFLYKIPGKDIILTLAGLGVQFYLFLVYTAKNNGICEIEGCTWGRAATWLFLSQLVYLAASLGSLLTSETVWTQEFVNFSMSQNTKTVPIRRRNQRVNVELDFVGFE
jgi:hypothetical protein